MVFQSFVETPFYMFIFSFCLLVKMNWFYKLGFVVLDVKC